MLIARTGEVFIVIAHIWHSIIQPELLNVMTFCSIHLQEEGLKYVSITLNEQEGLRFLQKRR